MTGTAVFDALVEVIRQQAENGEFPRMLVSIPITPDTQLADLGLDSLCKMTLLASLMDISDKYFPDEIFSDERTLREIVAYATA